METDGSPPHCIIYKYGFLHVSITSMCVCMFVCVFVHMPTLFPLPLCIWDQVCPLSMIWCVFADAYVCLQALFHCLPLFVCCVSAWAYTHFHCVLECVYVCVCVCVRMWYTYSAHFPGGIFLPLSSVWMKMLFIIDKTSLSQCPSHWPFWNVLLLKAHVALHSSFFHELYVCHHDL